jgi:hypothetical protein
MEEIQMGYYFYNKKVKKSLFALVLSFFSYLQDRDLLESSISQNAFLFFRIVK